MKFAFTKKRKKKLKFLKKYLVKFKKLKKKKIICIFFFI